jgi:O-antigen/teichoic acid export membrane protein
MSPSFEDSEYGTGPTPVVADTLADSVVILLVMTVVQRLVGFVRAIIFCRWLSPHQLGLWDMAFSFLLVAAPISICAIPGTFGRYLEHYRQRGQLRPFLRRTTLACGILAAAACTLMALFRRRLSSLVFGAEDQSAIILLAAGCLATVIAYNLLIEMLTALRNIRLLSAVQLINSVAFALLGVGLLVGWQCTAASVLLSYGGSCLVAAAAAGYWLRRGWQTWPAERPLPHASLWPKLARLAAWILLGNLLMSLFGVMDRYMIIHFSGATGSAALDIVGNYHASRVVPTLLVSIAAMLAAMITPHLSHDWEAGRREQVAARLRLFVKLFGLAILTGIVAVAAAAPLLFHVALRGKFAAGQAVLPWTLLYCAWFSLWLVLQNYLLCVEKARFASVTLLAGLLLNVGLNLVLLPRLGLQGAVLATVAANALSLVLLCWINHRLGLRLDEGTRLVLALPLLVCWPVWAALPALLAVAAEAVFGTRLFSPDEKRRLADRAADYAKRLHLDRRWRLGVGTRD